jgi:hypothetical protein
MKIIRRTVSGIPPQTFHPPTRTLCRAGVWSSPCPRRRQAWSWSRPTRCHGRVSGRGLAGLQAHARAGPGTRRPHPMQPYYCARATAAPRPSPWTGATHACQALTPDRGAAARQRVQQQRHTNTWTRQCRQWRLQCGMPSVVACVVEAHRPWRCGYALVIPTPASGRKRQGFAPNFEPLCAASRYGCAVFHSGHSGHSGHVDFIGFFCPDLSRPTRDSRDKSFQSRPVTSDPHSLEPCADV